MNSAAEPTTIGCRLVYRTVSRFFPFLTLYFFLKPICPYMSLNAGIET